jgi:DNA invertase Pin-like site-specific DNA recombinase
MRHKAYSYIRMSTLKQRKGDSWRRQAARTDEYVAQRNLELVDTLSDFGVSAFRGKNSEVGKLGRFIELVDAGRIAPNSFLIVESMDRLSRQSALQAFGLLAEIVNRGITVVTLDDRQEYSKETMLKHQHSLFVALGAMIRSHDESQYKSQRVGAAWAEKKRKASQGTVLSRQVPGWLTVDKSTGKIVEVPNRAVLVREIFTLTRDGWGAYSIAREFNRRKEPTWSTRTSVWRESYVKKILNGRAVCGEYTPHKRIHIEGESSRRVPDGAAIPNYYPRVVDETLYRDAASAVAKRRLHGKGRKGPAYSNLFTGILRCGLCGNGFRYVNKGAPPKGGQYLVCSVAHANGDCEGVYYKYRAIERAILAVVESLDIEFVLGGQGRQRRMSEQREEIALRQIDLDGVQTKIGRVLLVIEAGEEASPLSLKRKLKELEQEAIAIAAEIAERQRELGRLERINPSERRTAIQHLLDRIREKNGMPKDEGTRRALAEELRRLLDKIVVRPLVRLPFEVLAEEKQWRSIYGVTTADELADLFRDYPFEFTLVYATGETSFVDPLSGKALRLRGSKAKLRIWKHLAS